MSDFDGRRSNEEAMPTLKTYEGFGELLVGGSDVTKVLFTALCIANLPQVNQYLLDSKLRLQDRMTKTMIFPRDGMALPEGQTYVSLQVEELTLPAQNVTEDA